MPGKTNTDLIRELGITTANHEARINELAENIRRIDAAVTKLADTLAQVVTRLTVLEEKFAELKKSLEESDRKRWMLTLAVIGTFLALVANLAITFLRK